MLNGFAKLGGTLPDELRRKDHNQARRHEKIAEPRECWSFGSGGTMWDSHHRNLRLRCRPFRFAGLRCKMILQPRRCSTRKSHASLVWTWEPTFQAEVRRHAQEYVKGLQSTTRRQVEDSQRLRDLVESGHHIKTEPSGTSSATQAPPPLSSTKASKV